MREQFEMLFPIDPAIEAMADGACILRGMALAHECDLLANIEHTTARAPFRNMVTPSGHVMSVAMTNCGSLGWVSDRKGYRYDRIDPDTSRPWPLMPERFRELATEAADRAGYTNFRPDACLINRYEPGARLSLHQDKDEQSLDNPIVSVSLGLPAIFQFGGLKRSEPVKKFALNHGDVVVWGGPSRLFYHGVPALKSGVHGLVGSSRINLTFRKAG